MQVTLVCQGMTGTLQVRQQSVVCHCGSCRGLPMSQRRMTCPEFEVHCGARSSKKWRTSIKVRAAASGCRRLRGHGEWPRAPLTVDRCECRFARLECPAWAAGLSSTT